MRALRKFFGLTFLTVVDLFIGFLTANIVFRAQPTQNVRIDLSESQDRFGTRYVDVYLTNLTSEDILFDEDIPSEHKDPYGGVWRLSANPGVYTWNCYKVQRMRLDHEYRNEAVFLHYSPPVIFLEPGERKRISSVYVLSKQSNVTGKVPIRLGYQPGRELKSYWDQPLLYGALCDRIFKYLPIHHALLARKTYWSNTINVAPIKPSEIKGID